MVDDNALNEVSAFLEDSLLFGNDIMERPRIEEIEHLSLEAGTQSAATHPNHTMY